MTATTTGTTGVRLPRGCSPLAVPGRGTAVVSHVIQPNFGADARVRIPNQADPPRGELR